MRKHLIIMGLTAVLSFAFAAPALADTQATVNAQVTAQVVSIQLTSGSNLDFGQQPMGASGVGPIDGSVVTIYNNGSQGASLNLQGSDATNGGMPGNTWSLSNMGGMPGPDTFSWALSPQWGGMFTYFYRDYASYMMWLGQGESVACNPYLYMPTSTMSGGTYSWTGTIIASM